MNIFISDICEWYGCGFGCGLTVKICYDCDDGRDGIRTRDRRIRSPTLCPTELRAHIEQYLVNGKMHMDSQPTQDRYYNSDLFRLNLGALLRS